jgi:hypothetical protein
VEADAEAEADAAAAGSARAACADGGREITVDAFRDARLKLGSGMGSKANHLGRAYEQPALWAQGLYPG